MCGWQYGICWPPNQLKQLFLLLVLVHADSQPAQVHFKKARLFIYTYIRMTKIHFGSEMTSESTLILLSFICFANFADHEENEAVSSVY